MAVDPDDYRGVIKEPLNAKTLNDARRIARNYCINNIVWDGILIFCNGNISGIVRSDVDVVYGRRDAFRGGFGKFRTDGQRHRMGEFVAQFYWRPYKSDKEYHLNADGSLGREYV